MPYPEPKDAAATEVGKGNRRTDTKPEVRLRSALHRRGLRFRKDLPIRAGAVRVRPDIVFTRGAVAVFVDGCFWHGCPEHQVVPEEQPATTGSRSSGGTSSGTASGRRARQRGLDRRSGLGARAPGSSSCSG